MECYQMYIERIYVEHMACNSCGYCRQDSKTFSEDYESSDEDIEYLIKVQMLSEEAESDNL